MQRTVGKEFATFLTQAGKDIMGRVLRGEITLSFDKCQVGSGLWPVTRNEVNGKVDFTIDVPEQLLSPIADGLFDIDSLMGSSSGVTQATVNIPPTFGPATINEAAWLLEDGTVYAITRYAALPVMPPESGGSSEVSLRAFLNVGDVESVTLVVDSAINASREFVELSLKAFEDKLPGDASTEAKGIIQLSSALDSDSEETAATSKAVKELAIIIAAQHSILTANKKRELGQPFWHLGETPPDGSLFFAGQELSRAEYSELWAALNEPARNVTFITDTDWLAGRFGAWSLGDGVSTFRVPEARGDFLRVLDNGRGINNTRVLGELELDSISEHNHPVTSDGRPVLSRVGWDAAVDYYSGRANANDANYTGSQITGNTGGNETRPRSIAWPLAFWYE